MVRLATADDASELAEVHVASWQSAYRDILPGAFLAGLDPDARTRWWRSFIEGGGRVHVADADRVVGFCLADTSADEGWGEILAIYVHPDHWGQGHGHELIAAGMSTLAAKGHEKALLWVLEANERGRRFYERQGWTMGKPIRVEEIGGVQVTELRYEIDLTDAL